MCFSCLMAMLQQIGTSPCIDKDMWNLMISLMLQLGASKFQLKGKDTHANVHYIHINAPNVLMDWVLIVYYNDDTSCHKYIIYTFIMRYQKTLTGNIDPRDSTQDFKDEFALMFDPLRTL